MALRGIGSWARAKGLSTEVLDRLIEALVGTGDVGLAKERLEGAALDDAIATPLLRAVDGTRSIHLPGTGEQSWALMLLALVDGGHDEALDVVVNAVGDEGYSHQAEDAIRELLRKGHVLKLWDHLATRLSEDPLLAIPLEHITSRTSFREQLPIDAVMAWVGRDPERAAAAARLTRPHDEVLDPLAVALIERFGADSRPARHIATRASSTPGAVSGLARFFERQANHAAEWERRSDGEVARWAHALASDLRRRAAAEREEDELWRKLA